MLSESTPELRDSWEKMIYLDASDVGKLQDMYFNEFNEKEFNLLKEKTPIHKLTHKKDNYQTNGNTYYDMLIQAHKNVGSPL